MDSLHEDLHLQTTHIHPAQSHADISLLHTITNHISNALLQTTLIHPAQSHADISLLHTITNHISNALPFNVIHARYNTVTFCYFHTVFTFSGFQGLPFENGKQSKNRSCHVGKVTISDRLRLDLDITVFVKRTSPITH